MRKRQWKKILSVVLALAMVFSMNVSAFADEVTDPVAVEEPAAEQPVAEAPAEEPAPAAEETAEEPEAPAEEAEPAAPAKAEEPAGDAVALDNGWTTTIDSAVASFDGTTLTITGDPGAAVVGTDATDTIGLASSGEGVGKTLSITNGAALGSDGKVYAESVTLESGVTYTLYKYDSSGTATDEFDFDASNTAGALTKIPGIDVYDDTGAAFTDPVVAGTSYYFKGAVTISFNAAPAWIVADPSAATLTTAGGKIGITGGPASGEYLLIKNGSDPGAQARTVVATGTLNASGVLADTVPAGGDGTYYAFIRKAAVDGTTCASEWVATDPAFADVVTPEPPAEDTFTVSGYKFTLGEGTTSDNMTYPNGVGQVNLKGKGQVLIDAVGAEEALSINLVDEETELMFVDSFTTYKHLSILGKGTISLKALTADPVYAEAFENVAAGVTVSGNTDILISANNAGKPEYVPVFAGEDAGYTSKGGKIVAVAVDTGYVKKEAGVLPDDNKLFDTDDFTGDVVMLSENAPYFTSIPSAKVGAVTVSDSRIEGVSVKYGEKLIVFDGGTATDLDNANVIDVPKKGTYKWQTTPLDGMARNNGIDVDLYDYNENYESYTQYKFVLSTNSGAAGKASAEKVYPSKWQDGSDGYIQNLTEEATEIKDKKEKTFYLYARRKADAEFYKSDVTEVFSFDKLETVSISLNLANPTLSPNYIGDYGIDPDDLKKLAGNTNVINRNFFDFKFTGFKEGTHVVDGFGDGDDWNDNKYTVLDADNFKVGIITITYATYDPNPATMAGNFEHHAKGAYYGLGVNTGAKYAAELSFTSDGKESNPPSTVYNNILSSYSAYNNLVSFNVIKAPVKYEPKNIPVVAVSGQIADSVISSFGYKATNTITGLPATTGYSGAVSFLIDGKLANSASWNKLAPGTYAVKVSQNTLANNDYATVDGKGADYSTTAPLKIVDPNGAEALKVSGKFVKDVYYGEPIAAVKNSISASFTFGGVDVTTDPYEHAGDVVILEAPSSNIAAAKKVDETKTISANTTLYAYIYNVNHTVAGKSLGPVSSDAIEFTIKPRPVVIGVSKAQKSYRAETPSSNVAKADLTVDVLKGTGNYRNGSKTVTYNYPAYDGGDVNAADFFNGDKVNLDTSNVNINKPNTAGKAYWANLTGYTLSADKIRNYAQNYVVVGDTIDYKVLGKWYVKYILEYGGRGATAGKRYVSSDDVIIDTEDSTKVGTLVPIKPSSRLTASWNTVIPEGDSITKWEVRRADSLGNLKTIAYDDTYNARLEDYDFAVYAVVAAKATKEGVIVESIAPKVYDGMPHTLNDDYKNTTHNDLELNIYEEELIEVGKEDTAKPGYEEQGKWEDTDFDDVPDTWFPEMKNGKKVYRKYLIKDTDYTVTYKNNKNASVAYDETVSGNDGVDATFKRIVTDKKMPQVIIKGKGDYKSLKTTVLFDILPSNGWYAHTWPVHYQFKGKTLSTKATFADDIVKKWNPYKETTYKLKAGKENSKALSGYKGDYVVNVYKVADNGTKTKVTNFKRIAEGVYSVEYKFVNNYRGVNYQTIEVVDGQLLSKQTIKYKKKIDWKAGGVKASDFITKVKMKKAPKAELPLVGLNDSTTVAGYYISGVSRLTGGRVETVDKMKVLMDAGKYSITLHATTKLQNESHIYGSATVTVEVKGTKVKAADFKINNKKASKTVIVDYSGKDEMVTVTSKWTSDENSKVPTSIPTQKAQANNKVSAINEVQTTVYVPVWDDNIWGITTTSDFFETGAELEATQTGRGVYTVSPKAVNGGLFETYYIYIKPSGKYTAGTSTGYVVLSYKRGSVDLRKAMNKLIKVIANPVEVNVGGTNADLWMTIEGMEGSVTNPSDNKPYFHNSGKNQYMFANGHEDPIFQISYKNNKKVGTATATIKPTKYGKAYFKGSAKVPYTIKTKTVSPIIKDYDDRLSYHDPGAVLAVVNDVVAPRSGDPKVSATLYQVNEYGDKVTKLGKKDYTVAAGTYDKDKGYPVLVTAGSSGNFKFENEKKEAKAPTESYFNTFGKKAKKIVVTLSQGEASGYDAAKKGYVYTGSNIDPKVVSVTVDGQPLSIPADGVSASSNFAVRYNNDVSVGTATATITLIRDTVTPGLSGNDAYPLGGTVKVKYKIVPHTNNKLILSK